MDHLHKLGETTHERKYLPEVEQDQAEEEEDIYLPFSNSREIRPLLLLLELSVVSYSKFY